MRNEGQSELDREERVLGDFRVVIPKFTFRFHAQFAAKQHRTCP
jgi:hypothetical protein